MRDTFLPFARPSLGEAEMAEVADTLRSGWITTGPKVEKFTAAFADYVGGRFAVPVSSATAGLHVALMALGVGPGDEVITTPMTFVATLNTIVHCGAVPVLADIDASTLNIRVEEIEKKISSRTKAIVPVHYVGQPGRGRVQGAPHRILPDDIGLLLPPQQEHDDRRGRHGGHGGGVRLREGLAPEVPWDGHGVGETFGD